MRDLKIIGARRVTRSKFYTEDPQILGTIVRNAVAMVTWRPGFVCVYHTLCTHYKHLQLQVIHGAQIRYPPLNIYRRGAQILGD